VAGEQQEAATSSDGQQAAGDKLQATGWSISQLALEMHKNASNWQQFSVRIFLLFLLFPFCFLLFYFSLILALL